VRAPLLALLLVAATPSARAQTLRMSTPAPEGTSWARAIKNFAQGIESATHGGVRVKVYYGSIAGDELEVADRIRRDQLDGAFSGGLLCMKMAPSLRVMRVLGLFQSRNELRHVLGELKPRTDDELRRAGYALLGTTGVGPELIFSRRPITTFAELKRTPLWIWNADETLSAGMRLAGFSLVPAPLDAAARLYDAGKVDGFVAAPSAALAFQWSAQAKYLLPLRLSTLDACVIVANRFMDQLPVETRQIVREVAAHVVTQLDDAGQIQDASLLNGLFQKQGLTILPLPEDLRSRFFEASHRAREALPNDVVPKELLDRVLTMLADYRAEHRQSGQ
jgi:TRAP-type C4-dicarboxylate transport system substrate-binding protein